jgi:hypothetical protein
MHHAALVAGGDLDFGTLLRMAPYFSRLYELEKIGTIEGLSIGPWKPRKFPAISNPNKISFVSPNIDAME